MIELRCRLTAPYIIYCVKYSFCDNIGDSDDTNTKLRVIMHSRCTVTAGRRGSVLFSHQACNPRESLLNNWDLMSHTHNDTSVDVYCCSLASFYFSLLSFSVDRIFFLTCFSSPDFHLSRTVLSGHSLLLWTLAVTNGRVFLMHWHTQKRHKCGHAQVLHTEYKLHAEYNILTQQRATIAAIYLMIQLWDAQVSWVFICLMYSSFIWVHFTVNSEKLI